MDELTKIIKHQVQLNNGINRTRLILGVMSVVGPMKFTVTEFSTAIANLLRDKELMVLEFSDPESPTGTKTLLFMKETKFLNLNDLSREMTGNASEENNPRKDKLGHKSRPNKQLPRR